MHTYIQNHDGAQRRVGTRAQTAERNARAATLARRSAIRFAFTQAYITQRRKTLAYITQRGQILACITQRRQTLAYITHSADRKTLAYITQRRLKAPVASASGSSSVYNSSPPASPSCRTPGQVEERAEQARTSAGVVRGQVRMG